MTEREVQTELRQAPHERLPELTREARPDPRHDRGARRSNNNGAGLSRRRWRTLGDVRNPRYDFECLSDLIALSGVTARLADVLDERPDCLTAVLTSPGGL